MSQTARLKTLASLPAAERAAAVRALFVLLGIRAVLSALPFGRVRRIVEFLVRGRDAVSDERAARTVRRAVDRAARSVPKSTCLAQALTAELLLRRSRCAARVFIGVAPDGKPLDAHAWVESAGVVVAGEREDLEKYRTLITFGSPIQPIGSR